ncbi:MAG: protein kinase domain-containing protein, partial [Planctomycetota bacterium]
MNMPSAFNIIPDDYEIITTLDVSGAVREYIASYKPNDIDVRLKVYSFTDTSDTTMQRHLRNYLRKDVGFMEGLKHPNIIQLFDFSETRRQFWVATQPANINHLSECFPKIASVPLGTRISLVKKLLSTIEYIHNCGVVHRNISSNGVFLDSELELYVNDFGLACYLADVPTSIHDTTPTSTSGATYQAPEIKDAKTTSLDIRCDVFSAGLLAIEILSGNTVPKDVGGDFHRILKKYIEQQDVVKSAGAVVSKVLFKAIRIDPAKRWPTVKDLSDALSKALQNKVSDTLTFIDLTGAADATQTLQSPDKLDEVKPTDRISGKKRPEETPTSETPLSPSEAENGLWNNRYEIIEKIGRGGQAVVYKALDHLTNEEIAIKTLLSHHKKDRSAINRLKQEAMVARSLTNKYIVRTYSVEQRTNTADGSEAVFICMELIASGIELKDIINRRRATGQGFKLNEVLHIARQLLEALKYAHSYTIHRDIKPGNIMLVPHEGQGSDETSDLTRFDIRLMDFGIAKVLTQKRIEVTGKGFWSAHYGAPELADTNTTVDPRADLYSVGVIIYQMMTGHIPRKGSPSANKVNKNVPAALATLVDKAISADREKRFKSAVVFAREIEKAISKFNWIWKIAKVAGVLLLVTLISAGVSYFWPEPEYLSIRESVAILAKREPFNVAASLANNNIIRYTDIEGFEGYDDLRKNAIEKLNAQLNEWGQEEFLRSTRCWKNQEEIWLEMKPKVDNLKQIQRNQQQYNQLKDLAVFTHLLGLNPSSKVLLKIQEETKTAEMLLKERPLSKERLNTCYNTYNSAAKVYSNIERLAGELQDDQAAEKINKKLNNVKQLRARFLSAQNDLNKIDQLKKADLREWNDKCLTKANSYYSSFELENAERYFFLLSRIGGTISIVKDEIDFSTSDISLYVSRLMQLCHENIETLENYPELIEKLDMVFEKKDFRENFKALFEIIE